MLPFMKNKNNNASVIQPILEAAGLYDMSDEDFEEFCHDYGGSEEVMRSFWPNPATGLPLRMGNRVSKAQREKFNQLLQGEISKEELLGDYKIQKERLFAILEILWLLNDEISEIS